MVSRKKTESGLGVRARSQIRPSHFFFFFEWYGALPMPRKKRDPNEKIEITDAQKATALGPNTLKHQNTAQWKEAEKLQQDLYKNTGLSVGAMDQLIGRAQRLNLEMKQMGIKRNEIFKSK